MQRLRRAWPAVAVIPALAALAAAPVSAGDEEAVAHKTIHVEKLVDDCDGEECAERVRERRVIVLDGAGEGHEIEGHAMHWAGAGDGYSFVLGHQGKGGFLGVATTELTPELRRHFGVPEKAGVLVSQVLEDSAAARAGVLVGDILTAVDGGEVASMGDLVRTVGKLEPGSTVNLELWRDGTPQTLGATLGERQAPTRHALVMRCGDEDEDCRRIAGIGDLDCGDDSDCVVRIECRDGGCDCTVNGETAECETLPGFAPPGE